MGFVFTVIILLFVVTTLPISFLFESAGFLAIPTALVINLFLSSVLFSLYLIQEHLQQLIKK